MMLAVINRDIFCVRVPKMIRRSDTKYYITEYPENHHAISEKIFRVSTTIRNMA